MIADYESAIKRIRSLTKYGMKLGMDRINFLLENIGNPHKGNSFIHIAGTNGKGSTASMICSILKETGYKTGLFTSPYLERFTERIKVGDEEIPCDFIIDFINKIDHIIEKMGKNENIGYPTEFEIITAMCFDFFKQEEIDIGIIEVGLGGRMDSTNVLEPLISVITHISYDHAEVLGKDLGKIAKEKAGIIKENKITISSPQNEIVKDVIKNVGREKGNEAFFIDEIVEYKIIKRENNGVYFNIESSKKGLNFNYKSLFLPMIGDHQVINAATAITTVNLLKTSNYNINDYSIKSGIEKATWPGRMEIINNKPKIIIDAAHNYEGMVKLKETIESYYPKAKLILVLGILKDKEYNKMVKEIANKADSIILTSPVNDRALDPYLLYDSVVKYNKNTKVVHDIRQAIKGAYNLSDDKSLICCAGSIYLIGEIRKIVKNEPNIFH